MSTILLVECLPIIRDGLRVLLQSDGHQIVGEADNGQDALRLCRERCPQVVVIELATPRLGGLDVLRRLRASQPAIKLLVYSAQEQGLYAGRSLQAGADAFVSKYEPIVELKAALSAVLHGRSYFPREVTAQEAGNHRAQDESELEQLSARELTVLQMLSQGLSNKDIATQLNLSYKTVSTYKARLHQKLKVLNDFQLLEVARQHGLVAGEGVAAAQEGVFGAELAREHGMLRALIDAAPNPMFVRDCEGRLLMCNRPYQEYAGKRLDELYGAPLQAATWISPQRRERCIARYREAVEREEPLMLEAVLEDDGVPVTAYVWCLPYRDAEGRLVAMLGGLRYLTERDNLLIELRHQGAEARLQSQLKSETLAAVSREVEQALVAMEQVLNAALQQQNAAVFEHALFGLWPYIEAMRTCLHKVDELVALDVQGSGLLTEAHDLGTLSSDVLQPLAQRLERQGCSLDFGGGVRALKPVWINAKCYQQLLESLIEQQQRSLRSAQVSLRLQTTPLPRGFVCLAIEVRPWRENDIDGLTTDSGNSPVTTLEHARLQRLLALLEARTRVIEEAAGQLMRVEIELPAALPWA